MAGFATAVADCSGWGDSHSLRLTDVKHLCFTYIPSRSAPRACSCTRANDTKRPLIWKNRVRIRLGIMNMTI